MAINNVHQKKSSGLVSFLFIYFSRSWLLVLRLTYTFTAEARQEKENAKRIAAERAEQRVKKKAVAQQKVTKRKQAETGGKKRKKRKFTVLPCTVVLTVGSNYQNSIVPLFKTRALLLDVILWYISSGKNSDTDVKPFI